MNSREKKEEKNKRIGWLTSVAVQLIMLILFYFLIAWREPFPPIPEYGIELGFTSSAGAAAPSPQPNQVEEVVESEEVLDATESEEVINEETTQTIEQAVEDIMESQTEEILEQEEVINQEVEDEPIIEEQPDETTTNELVEEPVEEEEQTLDERAVMPAATSDGEGESEDLTDGEEESEEIDERAIYGSQGNNVGSNEGASLSLAGWMWDMKPQPKDDSEYSGKIVYEIKVDENGDLLGIKLLDSNIPPAIERNYRASISQLTFTRTSNQNSAPLSIGTITFIIKSK